MDRQTRKKKRDKRTGRYGNRGIITVFVTLIMVPVVAITGTMVDVTRLKMYRSQSVMAADSYGEAVLSEYDNLLKELYGLFSVTQNESGLAAIEELNKYIGYSFNPNGDSKGLSGFMPYKDADVQLSYEKVETASLCNNNVLMTQVSDFMKFRIVQEIGEELGVLDGLKQLQSQEKDMDAIEVRTGITKSGMDALKKIQEYYQQLKDLAEYPSFLEGRKKVFEQYATELNNIADSDDYAAYCNYLENKEAIDAACEKYERIQEKEEEEEPAETPAPAGTPSPAETPSPTPEPKETLTPEEEELRSQYVDADAYKAAISGQIAAKRGAASYLKSIPIDFDNAGEIIDKLGNIADELEKELSTLKEQVSNLEDKLEGCSDEVKGGIEEEIKELKEIVKCADDFKDTYVLISQTYDDKTKNQENKKKIEEGLEELDAVADLILEGTQPPGEKGWSQSVDVEWGDFMAEKAGFYQTLKAQCEADGGDKSAGDEDIKRADDAKKEAEDKLNNTSDETFARNISDPLAQELHKETGSTEVPGVFESFSGGLSLKALEESATIILDKFMVASYDFGMFSSRVSGVKPPGEGGAADGESGEEYADYSLTKVKMSGDVNYLYGAELEYLFGGHNESVKNLNEVRNIICGVRLTLNFISTYTIEEVNSIISEISTAASAAGGPFAPLVKVAVSGALRAAFAAIETAEDWSLLKQRKDVVLFKQSVDDLSMIPLIQGLLGDKGGELTKTGDGGSSGLKLSYENYLYILLCFVDHNTLLQRTSDLITLNVNQAVRQDKEAELTKLDFKMEDTVTAVKSTCKIKMDFVIVPENIMELFLKGTETENKIEFLEGHYYGYSIIRGY